MCERLYNTRSLKVKYRAKCMSDYITLDRLRLNIEQNV